MSCYTVFYNCRGCDFRAVVSDHPIGDVIPDLKCGNCGAIVGWNKVAINKQEKKEVNAPNFIPPMHSWFDPGAKRVFNGRKEAEKYAKENGKIWADDKELDQETEHHKKRNEEASLKKDTARMRETVGKILYKHGLRRH